MSFNLRVLRSALLVSVVVFAVGCKGGGDGSNTAATPTAAPATPSTPAPTTPATPATPPTPVAPSANKAPTIAGTAIASAKANSAYSFAPEATDADGDTLTFQIQNKPSWATFSTVSGTLSGTPTSAHIGSFAGIVISVSDGRETVSLDAFTITVAAAAAATATGAVTVSWIAPTENVDGSALTDLAGFVIAYGESESALTKSVRIANPSIDQYVIQDLVAGTYYFAVKAYNTAGAESTLSEVAKKVIN